MLFHNYRITDVIRQRKTENIFFSNFIIYYYDVEETCLNCKKKKYRSIDSSTGSKYIELVKFIRDNNFTLKSDNTGVVVKKTL